MKRWLCLLLVFVFMFSLSLSAFADGEILYCRKCGQKIPTDSNFCPYCGASVVPLDGSTAAKPSAVSPKSDVPSAAQSAILSNGGRLDYTSILNRVRVTKSPTSESVPYGGSCTFIAHAANATSITWIITTSDGSISMPAYEAANSISGLYVSGANTDTLRLSGIPSWMNGCSVQACFTGEGGPVYSEAARIWTYQQSKSSNEGEMLWWWPYRYLAWWWVDPYDPGPGPRPGEPTNVYHIGHENPLDPSSSWWDPFGRPIPQNDFDLYNWQRPSANPDFHPIAEGGNQNNHSGDDPNDDGSNDDDPTNDNPTDDDPTNDNPTDDNPTDDNPTDDNPTDDNPTDDNPTNDDPTNDDPTNDDPTNDDPTENDPPEGSGD